jgi:hypothetical protein
MAILAIGLLGMGAAARRIRNYHARRASYLPVPVSRAWHDSVVGKSAGGVGQSEPSREGRMVN